MRRAIAAHLESHQVSRVIYGAIIGLALVATMEDHPPSVAVVIGTLIATAIAVGLAELYSEAVAPSGWLRSRVEAGHVRHVLLEVLAVVVGVAFPVVFFALAAAGAIELDTAFTVAKWSGLGLIGIYGFCAARLNGANVSGSLLQAVAVCAVGGLVIATHALVH